jgi:hypothetical protein
MLAQPENNAPPKVTLHLTALQVDPPPPPPANYAATHFDCWIFAVSAAAVPSRLNQDRSIVNV